MYALISIRIWTLRHVLDFDFLRVGTGSCPCGVETVPTRTGKNRFLFLFLRVAKTGSICAGGNRIPPVRVGTSFCPCGWEPVPARAGGNRFLPVRVRTGSCSCGWDPVPTHTGGNRFLPVRVGTGSYPQFIQFHDIFFQCLTVICYAYCDLINNLYYIKFIYSMYNLAL